MRQLLSVAIAAAILATAAPAVSAVPAPNKAPTPAVAAPRSAAAIVPTLSRKNRSFLRFARDLNGDLRYARNTVLIGNGKAMCADMRSGKSIDRSIEEMSDAGWEFMESVAILSSGTLHFCPRYLNRVWRWMDDNTE